MTDQPRDEATEVQAAADDVAEDDPAARSADAVVTDPESSLGESGSAGDDSAPAGGGSVSSGGDPGGDRESDLWATESASAPDDPVAGGPVPGGSVTDEPATDDLAPDDGAVPGGDTGGVTGSDLPVTGAGEPVVSSIAAPSPTADDVASVGGVPAQYGVGPFSLREVILGGVWLVAFIVSLFPMYPGPVASVWGYGIEWVLTIGVPTLAVFLIVLRRLSPSGIRRVGSLGIDQFASVAFSVAAVVWLGDVWSWLAQSGQYVTFPLSWVAATELVLMTAGVVLTVFAPLVPGLREDFHHRAEQPAHRNARPLRPVTARPRPEPAPAPVVAPAPAATAPLGAASGAVAAEAVPAHGPDLSGVDVAGVAVAAAGDDAASAVRPSGVDVAYADADLTDTALSETVLTDAPLTDAPLTDAPLTDAPLTDAPIGDADLTDTVVSPLAYNPAAETEVIHDLPDGFAEDESDPYALTDEVPTFTEARPFWALAPEDRDVLDDRGYPAFVVGPTAWALVIEDRGEVFVIRHEDGRIGYLHDVSGVMRG